MTVVRPVYVGVGECACRRVDVRLYQVPGPAYARKLFCDQCLAREGFDVPRSRTAEDLEVVDGEMRWRR